MGHIFKRTWKDAAGVEHTTPRWHFEYWDNAEKKRVRGVAYTDRRASEHLLSELVRESDRIDAGYLPNGARLAKIALVVHLETYIGHLRSREVSADHVALVGARCRAILDGCGFACWANLDPLRLGAWLHDRRTKPVKPMSARTRNHYLTQFRGFVGWLCKRMGNVANPFVELAPLNADTDRRHERRALPAEQFAGLLATTNRSPAIYWRQNGRDRAMLYLIASYTGLRASEMASLTPESLSLASAATLTIEAGSAKNRKKATVPIHPAAATEIAQWLAGRPAGSPLWPGDWAEQRHAAAMLRRDLEAAGIPYRVDGKVFDFHAIRAQFITGLARAGVPLVAAQRLARHSDPRLTSNYYSCLDEADLAREVGKLPPPPKMNGETAV